jgi:hypothetical protein
MPGNRVQFDEETSRAPDLLARDGMKTSQELADEKLQTCCHGQRVGFGLDEHQVAAGRKGLRIDKITGERSTQTDGKRKKFGRGGKVG